jgi:hypothetical protein
MKPSRTTLTKAEHVLLKKLQRLTFSPADLDWLAQHLAPDAPAVLVGELRD